MTNATLDRIAPEVTTPSAPETGADRDAFLTIVAGQEAPTYAPGRNGGRQASFDAVAAWNAVGRID